MIAEFYIIAESFAQNTNSTKEEIELKTQALGNDFVSIRKYKNENKLLVNTEIYNTPFVNNVTISDLLYNDTVANRNLDRDTRNMLKKIVLEAENTTISSQEVIDVLLPEHNQERCHGLIAFNEVTGINPEFQVVYNHNGWLKFRRHYLSLYPINEEYFITECKKYFPELIFHDNTINSIRPIFQGFHKKIIYHLTALNDRFRESQDGFRNRQQVLDHFSGNCNLDTTASLEGDASRKPFFTYNFVNDQKNQQSVCCEPHIKLCSSGIPGDNTYYQHRIYFHEGFENISDKKILIGHIGVHL
jgi:hypothetical protein